MDSQQAMRLGKRFLPKIIRWLKKKFLNKQPSSNQGQQGHAQNSQFHQPASYQQPSSYQQPTTYQQPPYQQEPYQQQPYSHGAASDYYGGGQHQQQQPQGQPPVSYTHPTKPHHEWTANNGHGAQAQAHEIGQDAVDLRNQANSEGDLMSDCFRRSKEAFERDDHQAAGDLSRQGKEHQQNMKRLNAQAARLIYEDKNQGRPAGEIDLHGLYVEESIDKTEDAIKDGQARGLTELRVIVGKGIHSNAHVAKIKPAIERLMKQYGLSAHVDPHNAGVLLVQLQGGQPSRDLGFVDHLARQQPGSDDQCVIA